MSFTRRTFLQTAAAASLPLILPSHLWAAATKPSGKICVGFIGLGVRGRHLLDTFLGWEELKVVAVCDVDTTRREAARKRLGEFYAGNADGRSS